MELKYFIIFLITLAFGSTQNEIPAKLVTLLSEHSFVKMASLQWDLEGDGYELIVPLRIRTFSSKGQIIGIDVHHNEEKLYKLVILIEDSSVVIEILDEKGNLLKKTERQMPGANDGIEHSLSIHFNPKEKRLKIVYGQGTVDTYDHIESIPDSDKLELTLFVGKHDDSPGILGCVSLVGLSIGKNLITDFLELERSDDVRDDCKSTCENYNCNNGRCLDLFSKAVCDCRGTLMSGDYCEETAKSVNVTWDQYIAFRADSQFFQPKLIYMEFKAFLNEGVLIHGTILQHDSDERLGDMKLALIYGQLRFTLANFAEINFYNTSFISEKYKTLLLEFDYARSLVKLTLDGQMKWASWTDNNYGLRIRLGNEVFFSAGGSEVGISGCLRQIYVDIFDVVSAYFKNSSLVTASHQLQSCDQKDRVHQGAVSIIDGFKIDGKETENEYDFGQSLLPKHLCENDEATFCKNHFECIKRGSEPICLCRQGFIGPHCQFSILPWNCDDVYSSGNIEPGTYIIDMDGSGPLKETYVYCENGKTIIPHNMPNNTIMRSKDSGNLRLHINYKLMNENQLLALRENSESCEQKVEYDCEAATLGFLQNKTWFRSLKHYDYTRLTDDSGSCQCKNGHCGWCNCDGGGIAIDRAVMRVPYVPITNIFALNDERDGNGMITLASLVCTGNAARSAHFTATFRRRNDYINLGEWIGDSLSVEFRTFEEKATLFSSMDGHIELMLLERHLLLVIGDTKLTLIPQYRLNDGKWHRVIIEVIEGIARLSVNDKTEYDSFSSAEISRKKISLGSGTYGFLGCVRQVKFNGSHQNLDNLIQGMQGSIQLGCDNKCESHKCEHSSRCVQNFETGDVNCVCLNNIVYSGSHCEHNINKDSEISLHDSERGFLKIEGTLNHEALLKRIVFSVRTDKKDALLFYMHDHFYNFIQIHLSDYSQIFLTLNYNRTIRRCAVTSAVGQEYNRMQWIQIIVWQMSESIQLSVNDEICEIEGKRILSTDFIDNFEFDKILSADFIDNFDFDSNMESVVEPPVSPVKTKHDQNYSLIFVGGVPVRNYRGHHGPTYKSNIPNLLGCVRGLMIGDRFLDLRDRNFWPYYPQEKDTIRFGCFTGCEEIQKSCKNGGHCSYDWKNKIIVGKLTSCDCSRTSYYGEHCDEDIGVFFRGNTVLQFNIADILDRAIFDWSQIGEQNLNFAFSAPRLIPNAQMLFKLYFILGRSIEIILRKNGSLNIGINTLDQTYLHSFTSNFTDGYRHFVQITFSNKRMPIFTVDSSKIDTSNQLFSHLSLSSAIKLEIGGTTQKDMFERIDYDKEDDKKNYTGCISNVDVNLNVPLMHFKPILYLKEPKNYYSLYLAVIGDEASIGECSSFRTPGLLPHTINDVVSPEWYSPFTIEKLKDTKDEDIIDGKKSSWLTIVFIILLILLLILLAIILFIFCCKKKQANNASPPLDPEQPQVIYPSDSTEVIPLMPDKEVEETELNIPEFGSNKVDDPFCRLTFNFSIRPQEAPEESSQIMAPLANADETNRLSTHI